MSELRFQIPYRHCRGRLISESHIDLRNRFEAASACLNSTAIDLPWKFLSELAPLLERPGLRELPAPPGDLPLLNRLVRGIAGAMSPEDPLAFTRCLAGAMFYCLPHELPKTPSPSQLPLWMRVPYLKWSLLAPTCFSRADEAESYGRWLEARLQVLADELRDNRVFDGLPSYQPPRARKLIAQMLHSLELSGVDVRVPLLQAPLSELRVALG